MIVGSLETILYQNTQTGKIQQWKIWVEEHGSSGHPEVWIEHGQTDGKKQRTNDIIDEGVNEGKTNATSAFQQAILMMERKIKKQVEKGYVESVDELDANSSLNPASDLPKQLCFYKPKNSIDPKKLQQLERSGKALYTVKRDGMMHITAAGSKGAQIYTRRMDLVTDSYPHLVEAMKLLPAGTILLGEMIFIKPDGTDDFNLVSRVCRSDSEKALERQGEWGKLSFYIFDIAFFNGDGLLSSMPYIERRVIIKSLVKQFGSQYIIMAEEIKKSHAAAMDEIINRKLEGLVVFDAYAVMEERKAFTFNGKAERPNVLWKSKPKYEDDFIVRFDPDNGIGEYGTGKNNGKLKSVFCYQIKDGKEVFLAKCGGGLTDHERSHYTDPSLFPRVWRVEYDSIQPSTGSLRFPVFSADRTDAKDKEMSECLMSDVILKARAEEG